MKTINNDLIRSFSPCYDPSEKVEDETENLPVKDWVEKYRSIVPSRDIVWLLCRNEFLTDKDLRLFAVWCAREALKLDANPDKRSVETCNVAERFANGDATSEELFVAWLAACAAAMNDASDAARSAAMDAAMNDASDAAMDAAMDAACDAARFAAWEAARGAARGAAWGAQIDKLLTYFK